jgi:hypothetical protein
MPRPDYKRCRVCGRHTDEVGPLSHTRLCAADGIERFNRNVLGLSEHRGPEFIRWRRAMAASVGGVLLDDVTGAP